MNERLEPDQLPKEEEEWAKKLKILQKFEKKNSNYFRRNEKKENFWILIDTIVVNEGRELLFWQGISEPSHVYSQVFFAPAKLVLTNKMVERARLFL